MFYFTIQAKARYVSSAKRAFAWIVKKIGFIGGCLVYHPYRFTAQLQRYYFSPHYHFISLGWTEPEKIKKAYETTGYVFRTLRTMQTDRELIVLLKYLLSHSGVKKILTRNIDSVRYYGLCQNRYFRTQTVFSNDSNAHTDISDYTHDIIFPGEQHDLAEKKAEVQRGLDTYTETSETPKKKRTLKFKAATIQAGILDEGLTDITKTQWSNIVRTTSKEELDILLSTYLHKKRDNMPEWIEECKEWYQRKNTPNIQDNPAIAEKCHHDNIQTYEDIDTVLAEEPDTDDEYPPYYCPLDRTETRAVAILSVEYDVYSEKCHIDQTTKYHVLLYDPSESALCQLCKARLKRIIPRNKEKNLEMYVNLDLAVLGSIDDWRYYDYNFDGLKGIPYWVSGETVQYEDGTQQPNRHYHIQPDTQQMYQDNTIYESKVLAKMKEIEANWSNPYDAPDKKELRKIALERLDEEMKRERPDLLAM